VGGKSAFIHAAWDTPRPDLPHPPHPSHPPHLLPKYSLATKNEQCSDEGRIVFWFRPSSQPTSIATFKMKQSTTSFAIN